MVKKQTKSAGKKGAIMSIAATVIGTGIVTLVQGGHIEGGILLLTGAVLFGVAEVYGLKNIPFTGEQIMDAADEAADVIREETKIDEATGAEDQSP